MKYELVKSTHNINFSVISFVDQRHREIETEVRSKIEKMKISKLEAVRKFEAEVNKLKEELSTINIEKNNLIEKNSRIIQEKLELENSLRSTTEKNKKSEEEIKDLKDVINNLRKKPLLEIKTTQVIFKFKLKLQ